MQNPYESPSTDESPPFEHRVATSLGNELHTFFAWYFGAFIVATLLWHLSEHVRSFDLFELPMASFHFPLAGFFDPHDGMVRSQGTFLYAFLFWGGVIPVAFRIAPTSVGPLRTALGIIVVCAIVSMAYTFVFHAFGLGQVF